MLTLYLLILFKIHLSFLLLASVVLMILLCSIKIYMDFTEQVDLLEYMVDPYF